MPGEDTHKNLWNIGFIHLLAINIVNATAFGMVNPITPGYMVSMGTNLTIAGMIMGLFPIAALATRPLANVMGDNLNKKWLILAATVLRGIVVIMYALPSDVVWLVPIRILHGLSFSIAGTVAFSLGADYIPKSRLGEGIGFLGVGNITGMAIGPNIGIFLIGRFTYELSFILAGITMIIVGISVAFISYKQPVPEPGTEGEKPGRKKLNLRNFIAPEVLPFAGFAAIFAVSLGLVNSYLVMMGAYRFIYSIGLYFVANAIVQVLSRPTLGRLADRRGVIYVVVPGFALVAVAMTIISVSYVIWPILIAAVLMAVGTGGSLPALQASCLRKLSAAQRTVATGTYFIGFDIGMSIGQISGGTFIDTMGFGAAYGIAGIIALLGLFSYLLYTRREKRLAVN